MKKNACLLSAIVLIFIPSATHVKNVDHSAVALSGTGTSYSAGVQVFSRLGQSFSSHTELVLPSGSKYTISDDSGVGLRATLNGGDISFVGLKPIYPNPLRSSTAIAYALDKKAHVSLKIYDVSGRLVRTLVDGTKEAGESHSVMWDGTDDLGQTLPGGIYLCQFTTEGLSQTRKVILLK